MYNKDMEEDYMNISDLESKYGFALSIIGAEQSIYGHFDVYSIPDDSGHGILDQDAKDNIEHFLQQIENHYRSTKSLNRDYGDDLKKQNNVKRFVIRNAKKDQASNVASGLEWVKDFISK